MTIKSIQPAVDGSTTTFVRSDGTAAAAPFGGASSRMVSVSQASDFPAAVSGVRTLADNTAYYLTRDIDLAGDRLVGGQNSVLLGTSSESSRLKSTGLTGTALITSAYSLPMRFLAIEANIAFSLVAVTADQALDWLGVNFVNTPTIGTVSGFSNFIMSDCALLNSAGLTFTGTVGTIGFQTCLFDGRTGSTTITVAAAAIISRRFRVLQSSFVCLAGETAIDFSTSASIPVEGYLINLVNFSGGGTYLAGVQHDDNKAVFADVRGIASSASIASYYMTGNATATVVGSPSTFVKVAGTTTSGAYVQRFTLTANRATYVGVREIFFEVRAVGTISAQVNRRISFRVAKNGTSIAESQISTNSEGVTRSAPLFVQTVVDLVSNDYIEIFVANNTDATSVTVEDMNVMLNPLS